MKDQIALGGASVAVAGVLYVEFVRPLNLDAIRLEVAVEPEDWMR